MALGVRAGKRLRLLYRGGATRPFGLRPRIQTITPNRGPAAGGTTVTITGNNFFDPDTGSSWVSGVNFGATPAASFTVVSDNQITATSPAGAFGASVLVNVSTPKGVGSGRFTYEPSLVPVVTSLNPNSGPLAGGTVVTITGTNFTGVTSVNFGGTVLSAIPAPAAPTVSGLSVASGPPAGGTSVVITGSGFVTTPGFTFVNASRIDVVTPAGSAGPVNVTVTTPIGTSAPGPQFTYATPAPTVSGLSVTSGPPGTTVIITGTNFQ